MTKQRIKKLLSCIVAFVLVIGNCMTAHAASTNYSSEENVLTIYDDGETVVKGYEDSTGNMVFTQYLREVHPARLNTLILTGELWTYLADLNEQAQERLDTIMEQMKDAEGVTEELKRTQEMEWVRRCNNIHNRAEEIILQEMIYS